MSSTKAYDCAAEEIRRAMADTTDPALARREWVRLATLAASSHNTQPWRFRLARNEITVLPDFARRCPVVDPDDAHLFKSLGCAVENLIHAAAAQGYAGEVSIDETSGAIAVRLERSPAVRAGELFQAIPVRQCTKTAYDGTGLTSAELKALERAGSGPGVRPILLTAKTQAETVLEYVNAGNRVQLSDPAFRKELITWIRFNPRAALRTGDGLAGRTSGQPSLPTWLGKLVIGFVLTPKSQADADARNIRSSAALVVFVSARDNRAAWVETGRAYERFALQATALGIRNAFINQPIEVASLRPQLESWLGLEGERALLLVRIGRAPLAPYGLRRPLEQVIVAA
jgi:nitroreductase